MAITYLAEGGRPNGNERSNAPGSLAPSLAPTAMDAQVTHLLSRAIMKIIFDTVPQSKYASMQLLLMDQEPIMHPSDEFTWDEMPDQRTAITVDDGASAAGATLTAAQAAAVGNGFVTANVPVTNAVFETVGLNVRLHFITQGFWASVVGKTSGAPSTLQIQSLAGVGLPAIIQGQVITPGAEVRADGERRIVNSSRAGIITRDNFITTIAKGYEYGYKEMQKWKNAGTTDFLPKEKARILEDLRADKMIEMWNGDKRVQRQDAGGRYAKGTDGIKTQMINGGSVNTTTPLGNLQAVLEAVSIATNYKGTNTSYLIATEELLLEVSKLYKELQTRYTPDSMAANLNLNSIRIGSRQLVLTPCDLFKDSAYFPGWEGHMFLVDKSAVRMNGLMGFPTMDVNNMWKKMLMFRDAKPNRDDLESYYAEMTFAPSLVNPPATALIRVT
jgi:hypothetical protein